MRWQRCCPLWRARPPASVSSAPSHAMFNFNRKKNECPIPPEAITDPNGGEILRAWVAHEALHVSLRIPDEWEDPGHWGVALADVMRHLADAYQKSQGVAPQVTIARIQEMIAAELASPTDKPTGGFIDG